MLTFQEDGYNNNEVWCAAHILNAARLLWLTLRVLFIARKHIGPAPAEVWNDIVVRKFLHISLLLMMSRC